MNYREKASYLWWDDPGWVKPFKSYHIVTWQNHIAWCEQQSIPEDDERWVTELMEISLPFIKFV